LMLIPKPICKKPVVFDMGSSLWKQDIKRHKNRVNEMFFMVLKI
jgi:hypothetical protein